MFKQFLHQPPPDLARRCVLKTTLALLAATGLAPLRAETATLRVNIPGPLLMPFFPIELIPKLAFDRQAGVDLGIRYLPTGVLALEDMLAGNADFAGVGFPVLPKFLGKGHPVVAIGRLSSGAPPYAIIVRADLADKIRSIEDLRGRTLGAPVGSATTKTYLQLVAELWVSAYDVSPKEIRWAPITQTYAGVYGAMAGETVDAVFCEEPYSASLVREGLGVTLASLNDPRNPVGVVGKDHLRAVIVTTPDRIAANPERVISMAKMLRQSLRWANAATPRQIVDQLQISDANQRHDLIDALQRLPAQYSPDGGFSEAEIEATREFMRAVGLSMPGDADIRTLIDDRWVQPG
ncbi:MAG: ABC transporter substrate-binding protein [Gammaproteobacteria bacterium]|nr:ABC transporter substrate-binding protein [Gammaproteobacteria bacterium]